MIQIFITVLRQSSSVLLLAVVTVLLPFAVTSVGAQGVPIVQPGAPGEESRVITSAAAVDLAAVKYSAADVQFMQGMIGHHAQAVEMVDLLAMRSRSDEMRMLGKRIAVSQKDEIGLMRHWLEVRGQEIPNEHAHHMAGAMLMPGMLTPEEMAQLAAASGREFDRLFLQGMIKHHGGALTMVEQLFATPGAGQEIDVFTFASDVDADQRAEIERMSTMLAAALKEIQR